MHVIQRSISCLLISLLLPACATLLAQHPYERIYDLKDGLPALDLDGIYMTRDGRLWTCFAAGEFTSNFDGIRWENIHFADHGLPAGMKILTEDDQGLWFYKQEPDSTILACLLPDQTWIRFALEGWYTYSFDWTTQSPFAMNDRGELFSYSADLNAFIPDKNHSSPPLPRPSCRVIGRQFYYSSGIPTWTIDEGTKSYMGVIRNEQWSLVQRGGLSFLRQGTACEFRINDGQLFLIEDDQWRKIDLVLPDGRIALAHEMIGMKTWTDQHRMVQPCVIAEDQSSSRFLLYQLDSTGIPSLILSNVRRDQMKDFTHDQKGNIWYASATGMVRTNRVIRVFDAMDPNMVPGIHAIGEDPDHTIWLGGYTGKGGFSKWDGRKLSYTTPVSTPMKILPGSWTSPDGFLYFFSEYTGLTSIRQGRYNTIREPGGSVLRGYYFLPLSTGEIGLGMVKKGLGLARLEKGKLLSLRIIGKEKGIDLTNVLTLSEDKGGRIWMGRMNQGVAIYDPARDTAITWSRVPGVEGSLGVLSSCVDSTGTLWLGAQNGVYRLDYPELFDYLHVHPQTAWRKVPLPGGDTTRVGIIQESADYMIFGTARGLYLKQKRGPRTFALQCGEEIPDFGTEQNAVLIDSKGLLWVGTEGGALAIELDRLEFDTSATRIRMIAFQAGGKPVPLNGQMIGTFPADHRNILFTFRPAGNSALQDAHDYQILIVDQHHDTLFHLLQTRDLQVHLPYVPAGSYSILIRAYKHGVLAGETTYTFRVAQLLKENPWFWGGLACLLGAMAFLWIWARSTRQKQDMAHQLALETARREQDELKARALSNFFNPHFLNNSLHWVQSRYRKDPETALIVGRLAQNVDLLFANTRTGQVTHNLRKELTIVENYLRIQEIRFGAGLQARIDLPEDQAWLEDIQVPALLLQIHAENAIESGIRNRPGAARFLLRILKTADETRITIEDDGRGRPQQSLTGPSQHRGSTAVMNDLIQLYNAYNDKPIRVIYEDRIAGAEGNLYGTRVHINIPHNFRYVFS